MKKIFFIFLIGTIGIAGISCSKKDDVVDPPTPEEDLVSYNLTPYLPKNAAAFNGQYELIISTSKGEILIDTVSNINHKASIHFKTTEKRVDVTTICYQKQLSKYQIQTYRAVNPDNWDTLHFGVGRKLDLNPTNIVPAQLTFNNVPSNQGPPYLNSYAFNIEPGMSFGYSDATINLNYFQYANTPVYLLLPSLRLYSLYYPTQTAETVALQQMDTAVQVNFQVAKGYNLSYFNLAGLVDSTNLIRVNNLYNRMAALGNTVDADLLYPDKYFQNYQLTATASKDKEGIDHFSYGDSVRTVFNFPDKSNYSITASSYNKFGIDFTGISPAYYATTWSLDDLDWTIYASPDSSDLAPLSMMNTLQQKSVSLKSRDLSNLKLSMLAFDNMPGIDFDTYLNFTFNSKQRTRRLIYYSDIYGRVF